MESKHKNALIGALLAVVFVMAVGYAAFAQQLTINGSASITSNWDVHFDTSHASDITPVAGKLSDNTTSSNVTPSGSITELENLTSTLHADLVQPGDSVTFKLWVKNYGTSLYAQAVSTSPTLTTTTTGENCNNTANTCQIGHIKWTVTTDKNVLTPDSTGNGNYDEVTVKAEYLTDVVTNETVADKSSDITVTLNYEQVNSTAS